MKYTHAQTLLLQNTDRQTHAQPKHDARRDSSPPSSPRWTHPSTPRLESDSRADRAPSDARHSRMNESHECVRGSGHMNHALGFSPHRLVSYILRVHRSYTIRKYTKRCRCTEKHRSIESISNGRRDDGRSIRFDAFERARGRPSARGGARRFVFYVCIFVSRRVENGGREADG